MVKTNAMRLLDQGKIPYTAQEYEYDEANLGGSHVAEEVNMPEDQVFKTLVTQGDKNGVAVFCISVNAELDLKKAATASNNKKIEMLHMKDLLSVTGYVRGGCSPIGMKKKYPTYIDETAMLFSEICVSAGVRGCQLRLNPEQLATFVQATVCDIAKF